jgi:hypothetical protein
MSEALQSFLKGSQPFGLNPIIIGEQNNFHFTNNNGRDEWI